MKFRGRFLLWALILISAFVLSACEGATLQDVPAGLQGDVEIDFSAGVAEFTGVVDEITPTAWTIAGVEVGITPQTEIKGALAIGDLAKVEVSILEDGSLLALEIKPAEGEDDDKVEDDDMTDDEIEFIGMVESMADALWTIAGREVVVTPQTEIEASIQVGDTVKVEARQDDAGLLTAREIKLADDDDFKVEDMHEDEIEFTGFVEIITDGAWTVAGIEVMITPQTEIEASIQVGDLVKVEAMRGENGFLTAREIKFADEDEVKQDDMHEDEIKFTGLVESMSESLWTVAGIEISVTPQTELDGGLQVGDLVKVEAMRAEDGSLVALEIESADDDLDDDNDGFSVDHEDENDDDDHEDDEHEDDEHEDDQHEDDEHEDREDDD